MRLDCRGEALSPGIKQVAFHTYAIGYCRHFHNQSTAEIQPRTPRNRKRLAHSGNTLQLFGLKPFHADAAITFRLIEPSSVVELTVSLEQVPPTWRIKLMSRQRVGPERRSELPLPASIVTTEECRRSLVPAVGRSDRCFQRRNANYRRRPSP